MSIERAGANALALFHVGGAEWIEFYNGSTKADNLPDQYAYTLCHLQRSCPQLNPYPSLNFISDNFIEWFCNWR